MQTLLTDIGVNLMSPAFDKDRSEVVGRAAAAGVGTLIITGSSIESSISAAAYAATYAEAPTVPNVRIFSTAGVHPHNAKTWDAAAEAALRELISEPALMRRAQPAQEDHARHRARSSDDVEWRSANDASANEKCSSAPKGGLPSSDTADSSSAGTTLTYPSTPLDGALHRFPTPRILAIGECGLDYNRNFSPSLAQRKCFENQLALAAQLGKPVFLHVRSAEASTSAFDDFLAILKKYRANLPGAVVHCFTGEMSELEAYLSLDCYIGITGWICDERRGGHLIPLLRHIPEDRLLLETDAPYLLPRNCVAQEGRLVIKGKSGRNEPCLLPHVAAFVAEILGKTPEQLAAETSANAKEVFSL
jgi:TatD family hydrolase